MSFINALAGSNRGSRYPTIPEWGKVPSIYGAQTNIDSSTTIATINVTTLNANDIIILIPTFEGAVGGGQYVNYVTGVYPGGYTNPAGLSWTRYAYNYYSSYVLQSVFVTHEVFWAKATVAGTYQIQLYTQYAFDDCVLSAFVVNNANATGPFDPNPYLPTFNTFTSSGTKTLTNFNTTTPSCLLVASWFTTYNFNLSSGIDPTFTSLSNRINGGGTNWMSSFLSYKLINNAETAGSTTNSLNTGIAPVGAVGFALTGSSYGISQASLPSLPVQAFGGGGGGCGGGGGGCGGAGGGN